MDSSYISHADINLNPILLFDIFKTLTKYDIQQKRVLTPPVGLCRIHRGSDHIGQSERAPTASCCVPLSFLLSSRFHCLPNGHCNVFGQAQSLPPSPFSEGCGRTVKNRTCPTERPHCDREAPRAPHYAREEHTHGGRKTSPQPLTVSYAAWAEEPARLVWRILLSSIFSKASGRDRTHIRPQLSGRNVKSKLNVCTETNGALV